MSLIILIVSWSIAMILLGMGIATQIAESRSL
jgi:hypothetical protein